MTREQVSQSKGQRGEWKAIRRGDGKVVGYMEMFWHAPSVQWMTIPGLSRYRHA